MLCYFLLPSKAKLFVNKELRETWTFKRFTGLVGFASTERNDLPKPDSAIEDHLKPLFASVVKVYGASGFLPVPGDSDSSIRRPSCPLRKLWL